MPSNPTKKPLAEAKPLEDQIRQRAYELYEERGREDGHDVEDWLHAEKEIMEQKVRRMAA
jgi:H+-transporting ATPase